MKYNMQILVLLSAVAFCYGEIRRYNYYDQQNSQNVNNQEWSNYVYSINEGRCTGTKLVDEDVTKNADPFTVKKTTYTWMGRDMFYITCIRVHNRMAQDDKAAKARITRGGVGDGKVSIEMISKNGERLHFQVEIYGEPTTRQQSGNMAVLTNTPNKILYMGGKKYCECN